MRLPGGSVSEPTKPRLSSVSLVLTGRCTDFSRCVQRIVSLGVQSPQPSFSMIPQFRGLWTSSSISRWDISPIFPRSCWLKSKRPANSLSDIAVVWPLELQQGEFTQQLKPVIPSLFPLWLFF